MRKLASATVAMLAFGASACADMLSSPRTATPTATAASFQQSVPKGTGLSLDIVPNVTLPLGLGGSVTIDQAIITNFALVENTVGEIVGLQVTGDLSGTAVNVLGNTIGVNAQPFIANLAVTSSGPGQCSVVTLNLSNLNLSVLGLVTGQLPATVSVKGSGAVGSLLCNLGSLLSGLTSGLTGSSGAQGVVNALNNQIG
ncbi:MAG TPA: hypothetical protein VGJ18_22240 [Gemmatimonadaceae bacterium]